MSTIPIRSSTFSQVQLHGRLRRYRLPLHVCQLIHDQLVVDEATGEVRFRDYVEDDKRMAALFEEFVRNFYRRELPGWKVKRDAIAWDLDPLTPDAAQYLPKMQTDVSLAAKAARSSSIQSSTSKRSPHASMSTSSGRRTSTSSRHTAHGIPAEPRRANAGSDARAAGVLLYPEVHHPLPTLQYKHGPHRVTATGVDLAKDWRTIHQQLLDIVANA